MKKNLSRGFGWIKTHPWWTFIIFILILVGLLILPKRVSSFIKGPEAKYETAKVKKEDLVQSVSASGKIEAENQVMLKFQTSGLLTWVGVKEGDQVNKWQAVASLDKREMQKNLEKTLRDYSSQRNDFEETYRVDYSGQTPQTALTDTAKRILEKNQWDLDKAVLDVELKDIALRFATLVSPIEGIITQVDAPIAGVNITPATATFTVADPAKMIFEAEIDEADISGVKVGQVVKIVLDAYSEKEFTGKIDKLDFQSTTTKGGGTAFKAKISLPENTDQRFKIGLNGDAEIILEEAADTLNIPTDAIQKKDGKSYVKIIQGRSIKEIQVETGLETETNIEIKSGLSENQEVITGEKK